MIRVQTGHNQPDAILLDCLAGELLNQGHDLRITRDLDQAKDYLRERYEKSPESRFGLIASSRDKDLESVGVPNGYMATKNYKDRSLV